MKIPRLLFYENPSMLSEIWNYEAGFFVGGFLAEGNLMEGTSNGIEFSMGKRHLSFFIPKIESFAKLFGAKLNLYFYDNKVCGRIYCSVLKGVLEKFVNGNVAKNKHLSRDAWLAGKIFLKGVLDGFLAGDGYWDGRNNRWRTTITDNKELLENLRLICQFLGYRFRSQERTIFLQQEAL